MRRYVLNHTANFSTTAPGRVVLRFPGFAFRALRDHLTADPDHEQFAFLLALPVRNSHRLLMLVQDLLLPEPGDLGVQSAGGVEPTRNFQALVYCIAQEKGLAIIDAHTHVTNGLPSFSAVDRTVAHKNARYIARRFPPPTTFGLIVFNRTVTAHDALLFDRERGVFIPLDEIQIIGPRLDTRRAAASTAASDPGEWYARQQLIPGWNQGALANLRIGLVGLGGHGAQALQTLVATGAGVTGWVAGVDPDVIEPSNLPRLPYAAPPDVGKLKVDVAADFVRRKNPAATFHAVPRSVTDPRALAWLQACDVLLGCGDNDGVRLVLNDLSVRFGIPLIDLGADIRIAGDVVEAGGQVRVVVPGTTACLACCRAFDPGQAALDLLDGEDRAVYTQRGYVIGAEAGPTPSVAVLNALIAQHAVTALLSLIGSGPLARWDYLHVNWLTGRTLDATSARDPACPVCGDEGFLFRGTDPCTASNGSEPSWQPVDSEGDRRRESHPSQRE
jgi:molybdopterin/thiamine biosynthesis adenylyltransferase